MAIPIIQKQQQTSYTNPFRGNDNQNMGTLGGLALGAGAVGLVAATGGAAAAPIAASTYFGAAGAGAALGGGIGTLIDKAEATNGRSNSQSIVPQVPLMKDSNPIQRQLASMDQQPNHLQLLGDGIQSLGKLNDPEMTKLASPNLFKAYQMAYKQSQQGVA